MFFFFREVIVCWTIIDGLLWIILHCIVLYALFLRWYTGNSTVSRLNRHTKHRLCITQTQRVKKKEEEKKCIKHLKDWRVWQRMYIRFAQTRHVRYLTDLRVAAVSEALKYSTMIKFSRARLLPFSISRLIVDKLNRERERMIDWLCVDTFEGFFFFLLFPIGLICRDCYRKRESFKVFVCGNKVLKISALSKLKLVTFNKYL